MNGLRQHRQTVIQETTDARFRAIEQKLDELLALLKPAAGPMAKADLPVPKTVPEKK